MQEAPCRWVPGQGQGVGPTGLRTRERQEEAAGEKAMGAEHPQAGGVPRLLCSSLALPHLTAGRAWGLWEENLASPVLTTHSLLIGHPIGWAALTASTRPGSKDHLAFQGTWWRELQGRTVLATSPTPAACQLCGLDRRLLRSLSLLIGHRVHVSLWGCPNQAPRTRGLGQQTFISVQSWRREVPGQGVGRAGSL